MSNLTVFQKPAELSQFLRSGKQAIERALPKHLDVERMIRLAVTAWSTNQAIRGCSPQSIMASLMVAAQIGLEPGVTGQGYLIPYGKNCTFVPGWQGLVGLLNNSGRATAWTGAVFEGDEWDFALGSLPRCFHRPGPNFGDPSKMIWVYACGKVNGSEQPVVEAWPMSRVWAHRDKFNKVGQRHYSYTHPEMYARKVVLLQVLKYMPRSIELSGAITAADAAEIGKSTRVEEGVIEIVPDEIPAARIGGGAEESERTPLDAKPARQRQQAPAEEPETHEPQPYEDSDAPEPSGLSLPELKAKITSGMADANLGKGKINRVIAYLELVPPGVTIDTAEAPALARIVEQWPAVIERARNPKDGDQ